MKMFLNPKEQLVLCCFLFEKLRNSSSDVILRSVYDRLMTSLTTKLSQQDVVEPNLINVWLKNQQAKIDRLNEQNETLKKSTPINLRLGMDDILTDNDDEVPREIKHYPKPPRMPPTGKYRGKKR